MSYCKNIVFLLLSSVLDVGLSTVILSQLVFSQLLSQLIEIVGITPITHLPSFPCTFSNGTAHYNATSPQQCSMLPVKTVFSLGGSTVDLWLLSTVRLLFVFLLNCAAPGRVAQLWGASAHYKRRELRSEHNYRDLRMPGTLTKHRAPEMTGRIRLSFRPFGIVLHSGPTCSNVHLHHKS